MEQYTILKTGGAMTKHHLYFRPNKQANVSFDDMYHELSQDWQQKAQALQARRWRIINKKEEL